ncbi:hypothetical protein TorRG33x02_305400 [Trema orientale]|uniref:Uncharacterized protein n=1 Tax=Trema orientale TaxID=63057 RepID=A0A2P5BXA9_TREOI|nr:hypothetical protein TorRG33x02_305400 [Trema orientale]
MIDNEVKGELLADGGGRRDDNTLGCDEDVVVGGRLLQSLEESRRLAEGIVGVKIGLDLSEEDVHRGRAPDPTIMEES